MAELTTEPVALGRAAVAARHRPWLPRPRAVSDLLRLLPYLLPYRARWIAMLAVAITSLVATVAIPLMTRAVIDGPAPRPARAVGWSARPRWPWAS